MGSTSNGETEATKNRKKSAPALFSKDKIKLNKMKSIPATESGSDSSNTSGEALKRKDACIAISPNANPCVRKLVGGVEPEQVSRLPREFVGTRVKDIK